MPKTRKKYLDDNFKAVLRNAFQATAVYDVVENESLDSVFSKIFSDDSIDKSAEAPEAILKKIKADAEKEKPDLESRRETARIANNKAAAELMKLLATAMQTNRARGIRLAHIAARYIFANTNNSNGWLSGIRLESGRHISSSLFTTLASHMHDFTDLQAEIIGAENGGIVRGFGGRNPFKPRAKDWRQASSALFNMARRLQPEGATHYMSLHLWNRLLQRAPKRLALPIINRALRHIEIIPGPSPELIATVRENALRYG